MYKRKQFLITTREIKCTRIHTTLILHAKLRPVNLLSANHVTLLTSIMQLTNLLPNVTKQVIDARHSHLPLHDYNWSMHNPQALDLLNISINFFPNLNQYSMEGEALRHLEFLPKALGRLQFQRKTQLHYVVRTLPACSGSLNVHSLASSWQTA